MQVEQITKDVCMICRVLQQIGLVDVCDLTKLEEEAIETEIKYSGFIRRQQLELSRSEAQHSRKLPEGLDYNTISTLSSEAREKLSKVTKYTWMRTLHLHQWPI